MHARDEILRSVKEVIALGVDNTPEAISRAVAELYGWVVTPPTILDDTIPDDVREALEAGDPLAEQWLDRRDRSRWL